MKKTQYSIVTLVGAACLLLCVILVGLGRSNQNLLLEAQHQQDEINRGNMSQQIGTNLLKDMAQLSLKNGKMKEVLARNGYNVQVQPAQSNP